MATPTTRYDFKEYCLRALGKPVIQINVDDDQIEDRLDEALSVYRQFHYDAVVKTYMNHEVTASTMRFASATTGSFSNSEIIVGATSNTYGEVVSTSNTTMIKFFTTTQSNTSVVVGDDYSDTAKRTFNDGEVVTGQNSGATGTLFTANATTNAISFGDMDNKWFSVDDSVIGITRVFLPYEGGGVGGMDILFNPQAQFNMSLMSTFNQGSIIPYVMGRQYLQLMNDTFRGRPSIRWSRHMNRLYVDVNWQVQFEPGMWIVMEATRTIDPDTFTDVWGDRWLQRFTIALIKRQWGMNLSKYGGVALPGGVTLDGKAILSEANQEVNDLEREVRETFQEPVSFIVG